MGKNTALRYFSAYRSFHDLSLSVGLGVGMLALGAALLRFFRPNDPLLQHRNHLIILFGIVLCVSLILFGYLFSTVKRQINKNYINAFLAILAQRDLTHSETVGNEYTYTPQNKSILSFKSEKICICYLDGGDTFVELPRYFLIYFPKECFTRQ